ncbi:uncharacterized protein LOC127858782 isoform X3 [Dreissena polymorpha]|uniref:uncharacterized protein LOC127858782 isoform X3 n=1 Tax=Dreissena polymorpha TaxID=45954 RepID=UPI002263DF3C|nr:uncharacterized protein LOC127858782 isoform X3 [Dreissena polymorpha]
MSCQLNGTCTCGCNGDFYGSSCETPCSDHCARFENEYACSSKTGRCLFGCADGFTGSMCMQVIKQGSNGGNMLPAALGAGCAAFVIIAIAVAVGVFVHIRGRSPMYDTVQRANHANLPEELTYSALQANVRPTDVSAHSPVCGETNAEYQNTENEHHTYEIAS